jgi:DNA-binding NarL/FixJ family response regulator
MDAEIVIRSNSDNKLYITTEDVMMMQSIAAGKNNKEIAAQLGLPASTLDARRFRLMRRLKCKTTPQLVAELFRKKVLS